MSSAEVATVEAANSLALFRNPPAAFRPAAYWFWHRIPDAEESRRQLADFANAGFGTIMIQARLALPRDAYLSADYLIAYRGAAGIARELGLAMGLYDDYNWISGHAGGRTVRGRDGLRERHLFWCATQEASGGISGIASPFVDSLGPDVAAWRYEDGRLAWSEWTVVAALLHPQGGIAGGSRTVDVAARIVLTETHDEGCRFIFKGEIPAGHAVTVFVSALAYTSRLINYLLPEAAQRFIEVGLDPFAEALDGLMPDPVRLLFFDQPAAGFYRWRQHSGNLGNSPLYAERFQQDFERQFAAPFALSLLALVRDVGPETARLRCDFYALYSNAMHEAFFGRLAEWANRRGLALSGHEILAHVGAWGLNQGFRAIDPRVAPGVDHFGLDRYRTETAVDANNFQAQLSPKLGDSVARAHGRSRCAVEIYATALRTPVRAAGQWELTLAALRAQTIRLHCLGMRQLLVHAVWQTDGWGDDDRPFANPRFDFAPGVNFEPWWPYMPLLAMESGRLSAFMEPAAPLTRIAILYPLHTAWGEGPHHAHGAHLGAWCRCLTALGCDYLIIDEEGLARATVSLGRLHASGCAFDAVVLPSAAILKSAATLRRLREFGDGGGQVWISGEEPRLVCEERGAPAPLTAGARLTGEPTLDDIRVLVADLPLIGPRISLTGECQPWQWIGRDVDGWWRLVLFNDGAQSLSLSVDVDGAIENERWDPLTGVVAPRDIVERLDLRLDPHQLVCLRLRETSERQSVAPAIAPARRGVALILDKGWTFRPSRADRPLPINVHCGWELQGFPDLSGAGLYELTVTIDTAGEWALELPRVDTAVTMVVDGHETARLGWPPYFARIGHLDAGPHRLALMVSNTAGNRYYAATPYRGARDDPSGLGAPPRLIPLFD
jgi:hypothetical protein